MDKKTRKKIDNLIYLACSNKKIKDVDKLSVIIYAKENAKEALKKNILDRKGEISHEFEMLNAFCAKLDAKTIEKIAQDEKVEYIANNAKGKTCLDIAKKAINVDKTNYTGKGVTVAVIDTGLYPHPDINKNNVLLFKDFVNGSSELYDDNGHGTHVCGILAGNGKSSDGKYRGIAPDCSLIVIKVMDSQGSGNITDIVRALEWVEKNKEKYNIRIVSLSLGSPPATISKFDPLLLVSERLWDDGIVVVAAAGNEGPNANTINSPGISKKIITVGCSDDNNTPNIKDDKIAEFSSRGPCQTTKRKPDIVAPGVDIVSLNNKGSEYVSRSGTSMSTPVISGCIALLLEKAPELSPPQVKQRLIKATKSLKQPFTSQGNGLIDLSLLL